MIATKGDFASGRQRVMTGIGSDRTWAAPVGDFFRSGWQRLRGTVTVWIMGACVGVFSFGALGQLTHIYPWERTFSVLGLSYEGVVHRFCVWQFASAPLLHANVTHLLFNVLALGFCGPEVEGVLGRGHYLRFSVVCAVASMVGFLATQWGTGAVVVGYSGVIFGLLVAMAVYFPEQRIWLMGFFPVRMRLAALILGVVELYLMFEGGGSTARAAHLFGGVAGLGYIAMLSVVRRFPRRTPRVRQGGGRRFRRWDPPREL